MTRGGRIACDVFASDGRRRRRGCVKSPPRHHYILVRPRSLLLYAAMGHSAQLAAPSRRRVIQEGLVAWSAGKSMRCQSFSAENPQGAKFGIRCATPFQHRCQKCDFENPSEARFCAQCAATVGTSAPIPAESEPRDGLTGERRHLTVLFCDLVGSTEITSHLDPEQWREIVGEYHRAAAQAIERFGGRVAQYLGDGVMAYFGYPEAHDNDADENRKISPFSGSTRMPNPLLWGFFRTILQKSRLGGTGVWSRRDLNPRPPRCERGALPAELLPHRRREFYAEISVFK
jgi:hypothetical protein